MISTQDAAVDDLMESQVLAATRIAAHWKRKVDRRRFMHAGHRTATGRVPHKGTSWTALNRHSTSALIRSRRPGRGSLATLGFPWLSLAFLGFRWFSFFCFRSWRHYFPHVFLILEPLATLWSDLTAGFLLYCLHTHTVFQPARILYMCLCICTRTGMHLLIYTNSATADV